MAALWGQLVGCCAGRRPSKLGIVDETTPLIPPPLDTPPITITHDDFILEDPRTKERFGVIVRMKEGKMVNVTMRSPFNLRNENSAHASSSRSRRSPSINPSNRVHALIDSETREDSLLSSPRLSPAGSRSPSSVSLDPASNSFMSPSDQVVDREPALQARLVNIRKRVETRRGRTLLRSANNETAAEGDVDGGAGAEGSEHQNGAPPGAAVADETNNLSPISDTKAPENDSTPTAQTNFVLHSVGSIARDWGE